MGGLASEGPALWCGLGSFLEERSEALVLWGVV